MNLKRIKPYTKEIWNWLCKGKNGFLLIFGIAVALCIVLYTGCSEVSIRSAGYALQLGGMGIAIQGLLRIRDYFKQDPLWELFKSWLNRFPKWKGEHVRVGKDTVFLSDFGDAEIDKWKKDDPNKKIEERIDGIVSNLNLIKDGQLKHAESINQLKDSHKKHKREMAIKTKEIEKNIHSDLEKLHTSDLIRYFVGLIWLVVGITMSTMAPEIYKLLK